MTCHIFHTFFFFSVPPPSVSVIADTDTSVLLEPGTPLRINCTAVVVDAADIPITVRIAWTRNGNLLTSSLDTRVTQDLTTEGTAYLIFNSLLAGDDNGEYACLVNASSSENMVDSVEVSRGLNVTIQCKESLFTCGQMSLFLCRSN